MQEDAEGSQLDSISTFMQHSDMRKLLHVPNELDATLDYCEYLIRVEINKNDHDKFKHKKRKKELKEDLVNALKSMKTRQIVQHYCSVVDVLMNFKENNFEMPANEHSSFLLVQAYSRSYNLRIWKKKKLRLDREKHMLYAQKDKKIKIYDLNNYLLRTSNTNDYHCLVLEAINDIPHTKSRTVHIGFQFKNTYHLWLSGLKASIFICMWHQLHKQYELHQIKIHHSQSNNHKSQAQGTLSESNMQKSQQNIHHSSEHQMKNQFKNRKEQSRLFKSLEVNQFSRQMETSLRTEQTLPNKSLIDMSEGEIKLWSLEPQKSIVMSHSQTQIQINQPSKQEVYSQLYVTRLMAGQLGKFTPETLQYALQSEHQSLKAFKKNINLLFLLTTTEISGIQNVENYIAISHGKQGPQNNKGFIKQQDMDCIKQENISSRIFGCKQGVSTLKMVIKGTYAGLVANSQCCSDGMRSVINKLIEKMQCNRNILHQQTKLVISSENCTLNLMTLHCYNKLYRHRQFLFIRHLTQISHTSYLIVDRSVEQDSQFYSQYYPCSPHHVRGTLQNICKITVQPQQSFNQSLNQPQLHLVFEVKMNHGAKLTETQHSNLSLNYCLGLQAEIESIFQAGLAQSSTNNHHAGDVANSVGFQINKHEINLDDKHEIKLDKHEIKLDDKHEMKLDDKHSFRKKSGDQTLSVYDYSWDVRKDKFHLQSYIQNYQTTQPHPQSIMQPNKIEILAEQPQLQILAEQPRLDTHDHPREKKLQDKIFMISNLHLRREKSKDQYYQETSEESETFTERGHQTHLEKILPQEKIKISQFHKKNNYLTSDGFHSDLIHPNNETKIQMEETKVQEDRRESRGERKGQQMNEKCEFGWKEEWDMNSESGQLIHVRKQSPKERQLINHVIESIRKKTLSGTTIHQIIFPMAIMAPQSTIQRITHSLSFAPAFFQSIQPLATIQPSTQTHLQLVKNVIQFSLISALMNLQISMAFDAMLGQTYSCDFNHECKAYAEQIMKQPKNIASYLIENETFRLSGAIQPIMTIQMNSASGFHEGIYCLTAKQSNKTCLRFTMPGGEVNELVFGNRSFHLSGISYYWIEQQNIMAYVQYCHENPSHSMYFQVETQPLTKDAVVGKVLKVTKEYLCGMTSYSKLSKPTEDEIVSEIAKIEGRWSQEIIIKDCFSIEQYTIDILKEVNEQAALSSSSSWGFSLRKREMVLPSDSVKRRDIEALQEGNLQLAQTNNWELVEQDQHFSQLRSKKVSKE